MTNISLRTRVGACLIATLATLFLFCPAARAAETVPVTAVLGGVTNIDDIGFYGVTYRYTDGRTGSKPMGWSGHFDDKTGISATPMGVQAGKRAYLIHPIWHDGTGYTDQTYRLALPKAKSITFAFSIAMRDDVVGKSDGVTFRAFLNGEKLIDQNKTDATWADYKFDLTKYGGQTITLVFEADPGPKNDPSWDYGIWGDRRLVCTGVPVATVRRLFAAPPVALDGKPVGWGSASPTHISTASTAGKIESVADAGATELLGGLAFHLTSGTSHVTLPYAGGASLDLVGPDGKIVSSTSPDVHCVVTQSSPSASVIRRTAVYTVGSRTIKVVADIDRYDGSSVRVSLHSSDPYISSVHFGRIGPSAYSRRIAVPFYGSVSYAADLGLFSNVIIDYGISNSSALSSDSAEYRALTDGARLAVNEVAYYALSPEAEDVLPTPINAASPYRQAMGDVAVIDYWGGDAAKYAGFLEDASTYGLTHFFTIIHNWQHGGYDQQLPTVLPANDYIGGNAGLITLTTKAKALGQRVALHENYDDFYPNGPLYNQDEVAVDSAGKLIPAWMMAGHVSYLLTPVLMSKYSHMITTEVHKTIGTNASYIDVLSAIDPFGHTDMRATRPGAGKFSTCLDAQKELWQYLREVHGGPVLGEGANHWYWSGMLDGVEAQFMSSAQFDMENPPLFANFDLTKIHPKQINHGMGYLERWLNTQNSTPPTQAQLDDYRMQELVFGHSAFVSTWGQTLNIPFMFEEHNLAIPVVSRYASAKVRTIEYEVNGRLLSTADAVAAESRFDRVRIGYDNGLTIWANLRDVPWTVTSGESSYVLPKFGWLASGDGVLAYTATRNDGKATFAKTATSLYANARSAMVYRTKGQMTYATPKALDIKQTGPRQFQARFAFDVTQKIPDGYQVFIHFVSDTIKENSGIAMQFPVGIDAAASTWPVGARTQGGLVPVTLPADLKDGVYEIRIGLWSPSGGGRLILDGLDDGGNRYRLASLTVSNGGQNIVVAPIPSAPASEYAPNTHTVDFGELATNGSVEMTKRDAGKWTLIPLPRDHDFQVALSGRAIDPAFAHIRAVAIDAAGKAVAPAAELPVKNGRSVLTVHLPSSAVGYLLTAAR
ncbi:MAG: DUF5696 domain-containing protein [Capsulimonadaceae bacterium]|nr:DUF5696 domain-containing protein [Capsulimonadaceae bacterium]